MAKRKTRRAAGVDNGDREHKMTGPKAKYRGKVRVPVPVLLTPVGHVIAKQGQAREGLRRSDFFEELLRDYAKRHRLDVPEATTA